MLRIEGSVYQKLGYFLLEFVQTSKILPRQVDRVVYKTRRCRRRSSLLTTPTGQSTSRGCFTTSLELVDDTYRTIDQSWLFYYKSRAC